MPETVAFVGLGLMGRPMALHLIKAGHTVRVYNRTTSKTESLAQAGATACATPAEAAKGARVVCTCVGDGPDVREVILGANGIAGTAAPGTLIIDHSTIAPSAAQEIEKELRSRGFRFLDAPVSGGEKGAIAGTLAIMCGGTADDFEAAKPVLSAYGKNLVFVGGPGMGQVAKACNQVLVVNCILGVAEAMVLAQKLGADPQKVWEAVKDGAGRSWSLEVLAPKMLAGDDSAGFFVKHQQKDVRILLDAARQSGAALPGTALIHQLYRAIQIRGGDECGNQTLYRAIQILSGGEWKPKA
jgi:3-hydroxyisobutyrate dehydrogenase